MTKINWKLKRRLPRGWKLYECSQVVNDRYNKYLIEGELEVGVNGRNTAYITFRRWCINFDNYKFGFRMSKHFKGHNASHQARAWFRYLFSNCPNYVKEMEAEDQTKEWLK